MRHDPIPSQRPSETFDLAAFAKRSVEQGILASIDDPSEMKFRIMEARRHGHLSDDEARLWIVQHGLEAA